MVATHKNERTSFPSLLTANVNVFRKFSHIHRNDALPGALASCVPLKVTHNTKYHEKKREWKSLEEKLSTLTKLSIQWWELTELVQEEAENGGVSRKPMSNSYWDLLLASTVSPQSRAHFFTVLHHVGVSQVFTLSVLSFHISQILSLEVSVIFNLSGFQRPHISAAPQHCELSTREEYMNMDLKQ